MKVLIAGDFCPQNRVSALFDRGDFAMVLGDIQTIVKDADFSIVNFECPITTGGELPIEKCGPNLHCSEKGMEAVKWAGFDCVTLANNHFRDYGDKGVHQTIDACKKYGIGFVGGGYSLSEASRTLYKEIDQKTLAIINCCEHEFSIASDSSAGSNPLNPIHQFHAIKEARRHADYVLVIVHGGHEHYQLPSPRMKECYRFFIDIGADAVVNHHQHCYSGYETYKGKPIFYGLGNFCFDRDGWTDNKWTEGFILQLEFTEEPGSSFVLYPYIQCGDSPSVQRMTGKNSLTFRQRIEEINGIIGNDKLLDEKHQEWMNNSRKTIELLFQPYNSRITKGLFVRNLLPSFITSDKRQRLLDYLICEAHFDRVKFVLQHKKNEY